MSALPILQLHAVCKSYGTTRVLKGIELDVMRGEIVTLITHVDPPRLLASIDALAAFGARADGGVDRPALSALDLEARRHLNQPQPAGSHGRRSPRAGHARPRALPCHPLQRTVVKEYQ